MAKLALTLTLFICLLFAFSHAQHTSTGSDSQSILLPRDKPESVDPETTAFRVKLEASDDEQLLPLTLIRFRPVDRRFQRGPFPLASHRGRRCRQWSRRHDIIPYGNDMILSSDRGDRMGFDPVLRGGDRWAEIRHDEPRFPLDHGADIEWPRRLHHRRHHHLGHDRDHHHDRHEQGNGFLKSFRKFLGHL